MRLNKIQSSCLFKGISPKVPSASNQQAPRLLEIYSCPLFLSLSLLPWMSTHPPLFGASLLPHAKGYWALATGF